MRDSALILSENSQIGLRTKYEEFTNRLVAIGDEMIEWIKTEISKRKIKSINFGEFVANDWILGFLFYDCDKNGDGEGLNIKKMVVDECGISFEMDTTYDSYWGIVNLNSFPTTEVSYILSMVEDALDIIDAEENKEIIKDWVEFE